MTATLENLRNLLATFHLKRKYVVSECDEVPAILQQQRSKPTSPNFNTQLPEGRWRPNFYKNAPNGTFSLKFIEKACRLRFQLFEILYDANQLPCKILEKSWKQFVISRLSKIQEFACLIDKEAAKDEVDVAIKLDCISHWILTLYYCDKPQEKRQSFLKRETEWFILKYTSLSISERRQFLEENGVKLEVIENNEKLLHEKMLMSSTSVLEEKFNETTFYKAPFPEIVSLVAKRKTFLKEGIAYFSHQDLTYFAQEIFQRNLLKSLSVFYCNLEEMWDVRLSDIISNLDNKVPIGITLDDIGNREISITDIEDLCANNYPLCMQNMHNHLKIHNHLKFMGKMQYGLFLKYIGLPYFEALKFWKDEFTKKMDQDKYHKNYEYLFKHQYGAVGKHVRYRPFSCNKMISIGVSTNENHGCPFKYWSKEMLIDHLNHKVSPNSERRILEFVNAGNYTGACTEYFNDVHQTKSMVGICNPNQYFESSLSIRPLGKK